MTFSNYQIAIMHQLAKGPIAIGALRKLYQRPLKGLFDRYLFTVSRQVTEASITQAGWDAWSECQSPKRRLDSRSPIFLDRRSGHARQVTRASTG